mmetsp:Transcript_31385/g.86406  ORF Transcript_31385/g.86406 Transcript_31385/m.86406 type:complete len:441 (+) Transcript_31385:214-1536(+)
MQGHAATPPVAAARRARSRPSASGWPAGCPPPAPDPTCCCCCGDGGRCAAARRAGDLAPGAPPASFSTVCRATARPWSPLRAPAAAASLAAERNCCNARTSCWDRGCFGGCFSRELRSSSILPSNAAPSCASTLGTSPARSLERLRVALTASIVATVGGSSVTRQSLSKQINLRGTPRPEICPSACSEWAAEKPSSSQLLLLATVGSPFSPMPAVRATWYRSLSGSACRRRISSSCLVTLVDASSRSWASLSAFDCSASNSSPCAAPCWEVASTSISERATCRRMGEWPVRKSCKRRRCSASFSPLKAAWKSAAQASASSAGPPPPPRRATAWCCSLPSPSARTAAAWNSVTCQSRSKAKPSRPEEEKSSRWLSSSAEAEPPSAKASRKMEAPSSSSLCSLPRRVGRNLAPAARERGPLRTCCHSASASDCNCSKTSSCS